MSGGAGSQCVLKLIISGSALPAEGIKEDPSLCQANSNNTPTPNQCYQPTISNQLNITLSTAPAQATISQTDSPLTLMVGGTPRAITITNTSSIIAQNIQAQLAGTTLDGNVIQDASNCVTLQPGASCSLTFTPLTTVVSLTSFPIMGSNTSQIQGQIQINAPAVANISVVSGSPLTLQATNDTPQTGTLVIKNNSSTITATGISADISGALTSAGVIENSLGCSTLAAGQQCNLEFTPGDQAVTSQTVNIKGANTSLTSAVIAVNGAPQAPIAITQNQSLTLGPNDTGSMTIINNSTTEYAKGIVPDFTNTNLSGNVSVSSNTCTVSTTGVAPGDTCTITYTANSNAVGSTSFPIQGTNTMSVLGNITINIAIITSAIQSSIDYSFSFDGTNLNWLGSTLSNYTLQDYGSTAPTEGTQGYLFNSAASSVSETQITFGASYPPGGTVVAICSSLDPNSGYYHAAYCTNALVFSQQ